MCRYTREEEEEEEVSWHNQPAHRSWPRATCVGVQRIIAMSAVIYEAIILVCRCRGREGCPVFLSLSSSVLFSFLLIPRSLGRRKKGKKGGDFVVAHTDLPRARAFIGLPYYFTTDSGLKGLNVVVRMGSGWYSPWYRDIKSVRYEDYPSSNEHDGRARLDGGFECPAWNADIKIVDLRRTRRPHLRTVLIHLENLPTTWVAEECRVTRRRIVSLAWANRLSRDKEMKLRYAVIKKKQ